MCLSIQPLKIVWLHTNRATTSCYAWVSCAHDSSLCWDMIYAFYRHLREWEQILLQALLCDTPGFSFAHSPMKDCDSYTHFPFCISNLHISNTLKKAGGKKTFILWCLLWTAFSGGDWNRTCKILMRWEMFYWMAQWSCSGGRKLKHVKM